MLAAPFRVAHNVLVARRLIYYVACTTDGFIARKDGSFDCFLFEGEHFRDLFARFPETFPVHLRQALGITAEPQCFDTVIMGRHTYEVGLREGVTSPYAPLRQFVVSRTMQESPDRGVELHKGEPLELVRGLKRDGGKDIWLCGGSKLAGALLPQIDELILKINPVVIGTGIPLFDGCENTAAASLVEHKRYANGFVLARYNLSAVTP
jgi:dihydrofolate reductase